MERTEERFLPSLSSTILTTNNLFLVYVYYETNWGKFCVNTIRKVTGKKEPEKKSLGKVFGNFYYYFLLHEWQ